MQSIKAKLSSTAYYLFIVLFFIISLVPFQILETRTSGLPIYYVFITAFVLVIALLSYLEFPHFTLFDKWLLFLVIIFSLSFVSSIDRAHTIRVLSGFFLKGIFVAFISERIIAYREKSVLVILLVCASLVALFGLIELFTWFNPYSSASYAHNIYFSTIGNSIPLGAYLVLFSPLAYWFAIQEKRLVGLIPIILIVSAALLTFSRSSWFSLVVVALIYFSKDKLYLKSKKNLFLTVLVVLITLTSAHFLLTARTKDYFKNKFTLETFSSGSYQHRTKSYVTVYNILKDHPLLGVGFGNYINVYKKYMVKGVDVDNPTPDNMYLRILSDTGIVGAAAFFGFIIFWMHKLWKKRNNPIVWAIFCGLIGFLINQFAADLMLWTATQFVFWMLLGFGVGIINNGTGNQNR